MSSAEETKAAEARAAANPLLPKRGYAGQQHWQEGWEDGVKYIFERLQESSVERVHSDVEAILNVRHEGRGGKKRPKQLGRRHPVLPALIRRFDR